MLKKLDEAMLTAKAYCGRVITEWLAHVLASAVRGPLRDNEEIRLAAVTMILAEGKMFAKVGICKKHVEQGCQETLSFPAC